MRLSEVSVIGWIHTIACLVALVAGAWSIAIAKRTPAHKRWGTWYATSQVVQTISSFAVYKFDLPVFPRPGSTIGGFRHFPLAIRRDARRHRRRLLRRVAGSGAAFGRTPTPSR